MSNSLSLPPMLYLLGRKPSANLNSVILRWSPLSTIAGDESETCHFLETFCGLSSAAALSAAHKHHVKSIDNSLSVLSLLKSHGFTQPHIARLLTHRPQLLAGNPYLTLQPKLDFFSRFGPDITRLLSANSMLLTLSLDKRLIPNLALLRSTLHSDNDKDIAAIIKKSPRLLSADLSKLLPPKIEHLRHHGIPDSSIAQLLKAHPGFFTKKANEIAAASTAAKDTGISPSSPMFVHALGVFGKITKPVWEMKMENFKSLGWTEEEVLHAFVKHPYCMSVSAEKVRKNMDFFAAKFQWKPSYVSSFPVVLSLGLEKRITPRYVVWRILASKGLVKSTVNANYILLSEKRFTDRYINEYKDKAPRVSDAITGKIGLLELEMDEKVLAGNNLI